MQVTIEFNTDNDAFVNDNARQEIQRVLQAIQTDVSNGGNGSSIRDLNGNTIGIWSWQ